MSEPFLGEIKIWGLNFAPRGWAFCDGQLLPISTNTALFSLIGTQFGGDGRTTFAVPDLRGRVPVHAGQGPGLSNYLQGQNGGSETVALTVNEMAVHTHIMQATNENANRPAIGTDTNRLLGQSVGTGSLFEQPANLVAMNNQAITFVGGNQPHNDMQPYLALNFCIAMAGIYPSRN